MAAAHPLHRKPDNQAAAAIRQCVALTREIRELSDEIDEALDADDFTRAHQLNKSARIKCRRHYAARVQELARGELHIEERER